MQCVVEEYAINLSQNMLDLSEHNEKIIILHSSNDYIFQSLKSNLTKLFGCCFVVVSLKIQPLKIVKIRLNYSYNVYFKVAIRVVLVDHKAWSFRG